MFAAYETRYIQVLSGCCLFLPSFTDISMLQPGVQEEVKNLNATMEKHLSRQELLMEAPELRRLVDWMRDVVTISNHCCREIDLGCLEMSDLLLVRS